MEIIKKTHSLFVKNPPSELLRRLTFRYLTRDGEATQPLWKYDANENVYILPRYSLKLAEYVDEIKWKQVNIPFQAQLRDYQIELVNKWLEKGRGIISAGTGVGKTVMALYIAHKIGLKTLIVVPNRTLFDQWLIAVNTLTGIQPSVIASPIFEYDQPITVAMLHTLTLSKKYPVHKLEKEFGLVIYDEVHKLGADEFNKVVYLFHDKHRLGLSATPDRPDRKHPLFIAHLGGIVAEYKKLVVIPKILKISYITKYNDYRWITPAGLHRIKMLDDITKNKYRNIFIASLVYKYRKENKNILVLSDRIAQLEEIQKYLIQHFKINEIGMLTGQKKEITLPVLLGTYGAGGEGFDKQDLDILILASPRKDVRQAVGRVLRREDATPIVIDIVDTTETTIALYKKREKYYNQIGADIEQYTINEIEVKKKFSEVLK
ncbi:MAG: DEAD/DEAH box helicase family protein [Candidatus Aenigmatarchaeota archaeon]